MSSTSPEGQRWSAIKLPTGYEVCQISVGVSGLVWAILMNGKAIVRIGVTRENPMGNEYVPKVRSNVTEEIFSTFETKIFDSLSRIRARPTYKSDGIKSVFFSLVRR